MAKAKNNMFGPKNNKKEIKEMPATNVKEINLTDMEMSVQERLLGEVKAAVFLAKQFPRDEFKAEEKIIKMCKNERFADAAMFSFPRGNDLVEGFTIRMAEAMARAWGNIQYSIIELDSEGGQSTMLAYAWDVENNLKSTRQFQVDMKRDLKNGKSYALTASRDQYEMKAAYGSRFLRGCIMNLIPNEILEVAEETLRKTMTIEYKADSIATAKEKIVNFFSNKFNLEKDDLEKVLGKDYKGWTKEDLAQLKLIYNGIKEGQLKACDLQSVQKCISEKEIQQIKSLGAFKYNLFFAEMQKRYRISLLERLTFKQFEEIMKIIK